MVKEHIEIGVHFDFINGDGLYGNRYIFGKGVNALGKSYVLDVNCNQQVYLQKPAIKIPEAQEGKRGHKPTLPKSDVEGISVVGYEKTLQKSDYKEVRIRPTTKGWLTALIHMAKVWEWVEKGGDLEAI
jgi:SRSO17 transposase